MVDGRLVVVVYARWNTYVSGDDDDDLELYEQCFVLLIVCMLSEQCLNLLLVFLPWQHLLYFDLEW